MWRHEHCAATLIFLVMHCRPLAGVPVERPLSLVYYSDKLTSLGVIMVSSDLARLNFCNVNIFDVAHRLKILLDQRKTPSPIVGRFMQLDNFESTIHRVVLLSMRGMEGGAHGSILCQ